MGYDTLYPIRSTYIESNNPSGDTFSNLRAGENIITYVDQDYFFGIAPSSNPQWRLIVRNIVTFDTRYLLNRHLISGIFQLTLHWQDDIVVAPSLVLEQCFPTDPLNIVAADWYTFDMNVLAPVIPYENILPQYMKTYTVTPYGLGFINQSGGYTPVGTREYKYDFGNTAPVWGNGDGTFAWYAE